MLNCCRRKEADWHPAQSKVLRSFQFFQYGGDVVIVAALWQTKWARLHLEFARWLRPTRLNQTEAEKVVDHCLEGLAAAAHFLLQKHGNVIVDGKRRSHIKMLSSLTS